MRLLVGLGNPGREYSRTRHNAGFRLADLLAAGLRRPLRSRRHQAHAVSGTLAGEPVTIIKPQTYMNVSGDAVGPWRRELKLAPAEILVCCDDTHLPLGKIRVRKEGRAGGHHGLESVIAALGTTAFPRLRLGVGAPAGRALRDYVLDEFSADEEELFATELNTARDAVLTWLAAGIEKAMNDYNGRGADAEA